MKGIRKPPERPPPKYSKNIEVKGEKKMLQIGGMAGIIKKSIPKNIKVAFKDNNTFSDLDDFTETFFKGGIVSPEHSNNEPSENSLDFSGIFPISSEESPSHRRVQSPPAKVIPFGANLYKKNPSSINNNSLVPEPRNISKLSSNHREDNTVLTSSSIPQNMYEVSIKSTFKKPMVKIDLSQPELVQRQSSIVKQLSSKREEGKTSKKDPLEQLKTPHRSPSLREGFSKEVEDPQDDQKIEEPKKYILKNTIIISSSINDVKVVKKQENLHLSLPKITLLKPPYKVKILYSPTEMPVDEEDPEESKANSDSLSGKKREIDDKAAKLSNTGSLSLRQSTSKSLRSIKGKKKKGKKKKDKAKKGGDTESKLAGSKMDNKSVKDKSEQNASANANVAPKASEVGSITGSKSSNKKPIPDPQGQNEEDPDEPEFLEVPEQIAKDLEDDTKKKKLEVLYSGQEVIPENDPYIAVYVTSYINAARIWKYGWPGTFASVKYLFKQIASSSILENFMNLLVLINTITLALDRYNQPEDEESNLSTLNIIFTSIFIAEMLL